MAGGTNQRNKSFSKGDYQRNFNGRTDYNSSRPTKSTEQIPADGDKGIPSGINMKDDSVTKGGVNRVTDVGDKGIPPMSANPSKTNAPKVTGGGIRD